MENFRVFHGRDVLVYLFTTETQLRKFLDQMILQMYRRL
jgi:hypothetical protein